jgi:hypothetical protein
MFGGNVKSGNACPKCGSDNTTKGKTIQFKTIVSSVGYDHGRETWGEAVRIHNAQVCA